LYRQPFRLASLIFCFNFYNVCNHLPSFPTRRSSDLPAAESRDRPAMSRRPAPRSTSSPRAPSADPERPRPRVSRPCPSHSRRGRSEEHTSELQSLAYIVCRLLLEKKKLQSLTEAGDL